MADKTQPSFPGLGDLDVSPSTEEDWFSKSIELSEIFSPTEPIRETDLFAGRGGQLAKLVEAVFQGGQHAVIYGERGVGKTSLANTFRQKVFPVSSSVKFFQAQCFADNDYADIWTRAFGKFRWENGDYAFDDLDDAINPFDLAQLMQNFSSNIRPVFVFDEFDRITDKTTKLKMAETIKLFSDECPRVTVVIVGIGYTIRDLLYDHESIKRAIRQIEMPRMTADEIREILVKRIEKVGMKITDSAIKQITVLCRGMPGYAHLLGMHSAKAAINKKTLKVSSPHLWDCLQLCLEEAGESTRQDYARAVQSSQPGNKLKEALLACALADQNEFGSFSATAVRKPFTQILASPKDIPDFARHLKVFCSTERGNILERFGNPKNYQYKFRDAMMQCYVVIKGISDGMIDRTANQNQ